MQSKPALIAITALLVAGLFACDAQKSSKSKASKIVVACVGDSITSHGCASADNMTYVAQLGQMLGPDYDVINFGWSGHTMLKEGLCGMANSCGGDCSYWTTMYQKAITSKPDIVTIMLGTNDAKGCNWYGPPNGSPPGLGVEFRSAYLDMISQFLSLPTKPKVYVMVPPPLTNPPTRPNDPPPFNMSRHVINEQFGWLHRSILMESGADGLIDIWSALGGVDGFFHDDMSCDGCHPKDKAMTIIANTIAEAIAPAKRVTSNTTDSFQAAPGDNLRPVFDPIAIWRLVFFPFNFIIDYLQLNTRIWVHH